jgi:cleavage stimulation factor subunit 2
MSKQHRPPSRVVFIGNIAYDATKEQLINVFKEVGPIVNFRMVTERETQKPRGFAFCEYKDEASAQSAIRNLTGREVNGRALRVDFADNKSINMPGDGDDSTIYTSDIAPPVQVKQEKKFQPPPTNLPPPNAAPTLPPPVSEPQPPLLDPIMAALSQVPRAQLVEAVAQMKQITLSDPDRARQLLSQTPMLAIVMLHIQYMLGMLKQPFMTTMEAPPPPQTGMHGPPPTHGLAPPPMGPPPTHGLAPPPVGHVAPPPHFQPPPPMHPGHFQPPPPMMHGMNMPPQPHGPPQPPQPQGPPPMQPPQAAPMGGVSPAVIQQLLKMMTPQQLQTIMNLTPGQIEKLPPAERQQALLIQQNVKGLLPQMQSRSSP